MPTLSRICASNSGIDYLPPESCAPCASSSVPVAAIVPIRTTCAFEMRIRLFRLHLIEVRKLAWRSFNRAVCSLRFLYRINRSRGEYVECCAMLFEDVDAQALPKH